MHLTFKNRCLTFGVLKFNSNIKKRPGQGEGSGCKGTEFLMYLLVSAESWAILNL